MVYIGIKRYNFYVQYICFSYICFFTMYKLFSRESSAFLRYRVMYFSVKYAFFPFIVFFVLFIKNIYMFDYTSFKSIYQNRWKESESKSKQTLPLVNVFVVSRIISLQVYGYYDINNYRTEFAFIVINLYFVASNNLPTKQVGAALPVGYACICFAYADDTNR